MTRFVVQFTLPVDNPVDNVRVSLGPEGYFFEVPINTPGCEQMGFSQLLALVPDEKLSALSTALNKKSRQKSTTVSKVRE